MISCDRNDQLKVWQINRDRLPSLCWLLFVNSLFNLLNSKRCLASISSVITVILCSLISLRPQLFTVKKKNICICIFCCVWMKLMSHLSLPYFGKRQKLEFRGCAVVLLHVKMEKQREYFISRHCEFILFTGRMYVCMYVPSGRRLPWVMDLVEVSDC